MPCKRMLRAGTGAIWVSLCIYTGAHAASSISHAKIGGQRFERAKPAGLVTLRMAPWHKVTVAPGDSLSGLFTQLHIAADQWVAVLKLGGAVDALKHLHPGDVLEIHDTRGGRLDGLQYRLNKRQMLVVSRDRHGLHAKVERPDVDTRPVTAIGSVGQSLARSLARAAVPSTVANQLSQIYRHRDNLSQNMHPGDTFSVVYTADYSDGEQISAGPIIAASITTAGHNHKAFRVVDNNGNPGYYDTRGRPYRPVFLRHPVAYSRISSPFSLHREDPVLHVVRPHYGVDLAAPTGTAVHAAANGTVKFVGREHGYGRLVELRHIEGYTTRYAHLHGFVHDLHDGERVRAGQTIGYVGETGEATGPHLHFEIRKNGVAHNPLTTELPAGKSLTAHRLAAFSRRIRPLIAKLKGQSNTLLASATSAPAAPPSCRRTIALNAALALDPMGAAHQHTLQNLFCIVGQSSARQRVARNEGG